MLSQDLISSPENIVSDEIQKFNHSYQTYANSKFSLAPDDSIWEYNGLHEAYQGDCEEKLLEMQRIFYEDLRVEETKGWQEGLVSHLLARRVERGLSSYLLLSLWTQAQRDDEVNLEVLQNRLDEAHSDHLDPNSALKLDLSGVQHV